MRLVGYHVVHLVSVHMSLIDLLLWVEVICRGEGGLQFCGRQWSVCPTAHFCRLVKSCMKTASDK